MLGMGNWMDQYTRSREVRRGQAIKTKGSSRRTWKREEAREEGQWSRWTCCLVLDV